jgi:uncharacterized protein involved in response to NO
MSLAAGHAQRSQQPALLTQGFRPFFLAAGLWAAAALALWIVMLETGMTLPSRFDALTWHIHEMLFGFVMAAVAGFLLTAIPNWTRRLPVSGVPLGNLAGLWLIGRFACMTSAWYPAWIGIAADLGFPLALAAVVAREIIAAKDRRNMAMILPVVVLGVANLLMHLEANGLGIPAGLGWRLALAAILVLVSVIGGRIIPGFTRNWLSLRKVAELPAKHGLADRLALGSLHAGLFGWAFFPAQPITGALLILAALFNLWRLSRWQGARTMAEPLLLILHAGYGWLAVGAGLLGASMLTSSVPQTAGVHAMTVGAIGTMILAVMTRATRGHTGRPLSADRMTRLLYVCALSAAVLRIAAAFAGPWTMPLLIAAAAFWIAAFVLFLVRYAPMLCLPR